MRDLMLSLLQPRFDAMRDEVIEALEARIIVLSAQAANAFESALLSALSDLDAEGGHSVRIEPIAPPAKRQRAAAKSHGPSDVLGVGTAVHPGKPASFDGPPSSPVRVHRDPKPDNTPQGRTANGKAWPTCSVCGKRGVTARTHPAHVGATDKPLLAAAKPDRIAALRKRQASRLPDPPVASIGEDEDDEEALDVAIERAERTKKSGAMPKPRSSFRVERGEVAELDFEGGE